VGPGCPGRDGYAVASTVEVEAEGLTVRTSRDEVLVRVPLDALRSETISVLTDSYQTLFMSCYREEKARREAAAVRLGEALANADILPLRAENHEDYRPA